MKKLSGILLICLFALPAYSQMKIKHSKERMDYVVGLENDTIWGEIRYGNHILGSRLSKIVLFDEEGKKNKFLANQVSGFYNDRAYYTTVKLDGYKYFARKVVSGTVNMYFFEYAFASNYNTQYATKTDDIGVGGKMITVLLERNGNVQRIFKKKIEEDVFPFLGDNTEIMESIEKGECSFDELDQVVAAYNDWVNQK